MNTIHFIVNDSAEGYVACAVGADIVTEAGNLPDLHTQVRDAVHCYFSPDKMPALIRLHITREEVLDAL